MGGAWPKHTRCVIVKTWTEVAWILIFKVGVYN